MTGLPSLLVLTWLLHADPAGAAIKGTITDVSGRPLAAARVDVASAAARTVRGGFSPNCYPDCRKHVRTNALGQFEIQGLDPSLKFRLLASMPGKEPDVTEFVFPPENGLTIALKDVPTNWPPKQIVRGRVVNTDGAPLEAAYVEAYGTQAAGQRFGGNLDVRPTVTDAQGNFELLLPKNYEFVDVRANADGYVGASVLKFEPGADIVVPKGARVTGRIVHGGQPVAGASVAVTQMQTGRHFVWAVGDTTGEDGTFACEYLPPDEAYAIFSVLGLGPQEFVLTTKRFKAPADQTERDLGDLETVPALSLSGRVELPAGQSLPQDAKIWLFRKAAWDSVGIEIEADGRFIFAGLPPETFDVHPSIPGFQVDPTRIKYQTPRDQTFTLRVVQSIDDLRIPLEAKP